VFEAIEIKRMSVVDYEMCFQVVQAGCQVALVDVPVTITGLVPLLIAVCLSPNWDFILVQLGYVPGYSHIKIS